jgi:hypothetical protein
MSYNEEFICPDCGVKIYWIMGPYVDNKPTDQALICFKCHKLILWKAAQK